jgi:large subunit ribosomal protein L6
MSRIGKKPIAIPKGVTVKVHAGAVEVQGPRGKLRQIVPAQVAFEVADGQIHAKTVREDPALGKFHGLARTLVANAVQGVTEGFKRELDIVGIGYRGEVRGRQVVFALGYSHPVVFDVPEGIEIAIDKQTHVTVTGADRQQVGQVAANIRSLRKPDPYKQKGIRYTGEVLKKKVGKTGA